MSLISIFSLLLSQLWWLVLLVILASIAKTPWFKGCFGELLVRLYAKLLLDKNVYLPIHNVTINTLDGTTQIDHVFVSRFGIFVVETKNYRGWIFGGEHQASWTQKIFKTTNKFQNPLRQNYKHIKAIEALLNIPPEKIFSVIVFVGDSIFKTPMPKNVTYAWGYIRYIKSKNQEVFTASEVEAIFQALCNGRLTPSLATNLEHINNLKQRNEPTSERLCHKCGAEMVLRTAKHGKNTGNPFWGCSQYPKCHSIQNIA